jgi:DNA-binding NarL/FixJ family response regulator
MSKRDPATGKAVDLPSGGAADRRQMDRASLRVSIAHPDPRVRRLLRFLVDDDPRFVVTHETATVSGAVASGIGSDVVVLDIVFPEGDGFAALGRIKNESPGTAVVVYSSFDPPYLRAEAAARGAEAFVSRTAGCDALLDAIEQAGRSNRQLSRHEGPRD